MTRRNCPACRGTGYLVEEKDGALVASPCKCRTPDRSTRLIQKAGIPQRYRERCVFEKFRPSDASQEFALSVAKKYAEDYPAFPDEAINGLLFMGSSGVGKTHLAVSILQEILMHKGMPALFMDLNDLYREIRATYDKREGSETEYDIMAPLVEAPFLLIDEMGCLNSPWAQDTLHYLISQRYNEQHPTLCTTNYLDEPRGGEPSLEDRIGTRTRSRLHEMCRTVLINGADYRKRNI